MAPLPTLPAERPRRRAGLSASLFRALTSSRATVSPSGPSRPLFNPVGRVRACLAHLVKLRRGRAAISGLRGMGHRESERAGACGNNDDSNLHRNTHLQPRWCGLRCQVAQRRGPCESCVSLRSCRRERMRARRRQRTAFHQMSPTAAGRLSGNLAG
jgi:hypothetical protein